MRAGRLRAALISVGGLGVGLIGLAAAPAAQAAGTIELPRKEVAKIVVQTGGEQPARCYVAGRAASDRDWAIVTYRTDPVPKGCQPGDGYWVVHRTAGVWSDSADIPVVTVSCTALKRDLREAGAPRSVFTDFKAAGACSTRIP
jgi:hypothetical protein